MPKQSGLVVSIGCRKHQFHVALCFEWSFSSHSPGEDVHQAPAAPGVSHAPLHARPVANPNSCVGGEVYASSFWGSSLIWEPESLLQTTGREALPKCALDPRLKSPSVGAFLSLFCLRREISNLILACKVDGMNAHFKD